MSETIEAPVDTRSIKLEVLFSCVATCDSEQVVNFDEIVIDGATAGPPTAVALSALSARRLSTGVLVSWRTGAENKVVGYEVWRSTSGAFRKLTSSPLRASLRPSGSRYQYRDRTARPGATYTYRIAAVSVDGTSTVLGSVRVVVAAR